MTDMRVEHRLVGISGRVVLDHHPKSAVVEWEDNGTRTVEDWKHLKPLHHSERCGYVVDGFELPPGVHPDSDIGCTE